MNRESWRQVKKIFQEAIELDPANRSAFVRENCADNDNLRVEVEYLLNSYDDEFPNRPKTYSAPNVLEKGQEIEHYEIVEKIGAGGMGEVYLAKDSKLGRDTALKVLSSQFFESPDRMRRFVQEARAASSLNHPNILTIYEIDESNGIRFLATEFVKGETLRAYLKNGRISVEESLEIAIQVASALAAAHENDITHRDIKPENIMRRSKDGLIKILDFGLAKLSEKTNSTQDINPQATTLLNTQPGTIMGTVAYMSPEQLRGQKVDGRSDIWSLGVVLYEMIAGKPPFDGETSSDIIASALKSEVVPPTQVNSQIPPEFDRLIGKTLAKNRDDRYQSAGELCNDLKELQKQLDVEDELKRSGQLRAVGTLPASKKPLRIAGAIIVTLLLLIGGYFVWQSSKRLPQFDKVSLKALTTGGNIVESAISPDGKMLAYVKNEHGKQSLWVRQTPLQTAEIRLTETNDEQTFNGLSFTPDGSQIYYLTRPKNSSITQLYSIPLLGGQPPRLILTDVDSPPTFAPDGKQFAFMRRNVQSGITALLTTDENGGNLKTIVERKSPLDFMLRPLAWSPDGKKIACISNTASQTSSLAKRYIVEIDVQTGAEKTISDQVWNEFESIAWSKDGRGLIFTASESKTPLQFQLWFMPYPNGAPQKITSDLNYYGNVRIAQNSGDIIARQIQNEANVWVVDLKSSNAQPRRVSQGNADGSNGISWAGSGNLVYTSIINGVNSLQKTGLDNNSASTLTTGDYVLSQPCATPDGKYFVYTSTLDESMRLWRIDANGGNLTQLTTVNGEFTNCSPDSRWVFFNTLKNGQSSLWKIPVEGGEPQRITEKITLRPQISPDGKRIACYYRAEAKSPWQFAVLSVDEDAILQTMDLPKTVQLNTAFAWAKDGKALILLDTRDGISNLWRYPLDGSAPTPVTNFTDESLPRIINFSVSPSGDQIALTRGRRISDIVQIISQ